MIPKKEKEIDEKDREILGELMKNGKARVRDIAKKFGLPMSTVHHRIIGMEKNGVIKGYATIPDYRKMGFGLSAFVFITVNYEKVKSQEGIALEIAKIENVDGTYIVTGETDILAKVRARDIDELNDVVTRRLRAIDGVEKTRTAVILKEISRG